MRLTNRLQRLERTDLLRRRLTPMDQLERALDEAAFRLTGKGSAEMADHTVMERALEDLSDSFFPKLGTAELDQLTAELEHIVFGNDTAAMERCKREVLRVLGSAQ